MIGVLFTLTLIYGNEVRSNMQDQITETKARIGTLENSLVTVIIENTKTTGELRLEVALLRREIERLREAGESKRQTR